MRWEEWSGDLTIFAIYQFQMAGKMNCRRAFVNLGANLKFENKNE